jgi:hypothetical protein
MHDTEIGVDDEFHGSTRTEEGSTSSTQSSAFAPRAH